MRQNPQHYSSLKYFGSEFVSKFQQSAQALEYILCLGRTTTKACKILKNDIGVQYWNQLNLKAAATLAKHYTLEKITISLTNSQFYKEITALSYAGDIRYKLGGEIPTKLTTCYQNFERFQEYYKPIYKEVVLNDSFYLPKGSH
ncbi:CBM_collapsed_G0024410.mRNA.1.CDS.1 [Saccharomyces cerevisiae]|nr:CBM_collapsed_G0024410.mRNA.1.CDS.1 [Saccharomyces cerevisiae]